VRNIAFAGKEVPNDTHRVEGDQNASEDSRRDGRPWRAAALLHLPFRHVIRGQRLRDEIVECGRLSDRARITFPVTFCTGYADKRHASIREMEEIAWVLKSDPHRNQIGFVESRKLKPKDRYVLPEEWD
jgi:hypothetical protein